MNQVDVHDVVIVVLRKLVFKSHVVITIQVI
jgi:hypothetical protein